MIAFEVENDTKYITVLTTLIQTSHGKHDWFNIFRTFSTIFDQRSQKNVMLQSMNHGETSNQL